MLTIPTLCWTCLYHQNSLSYDHPKSPVWIPCGNYPYHHQNITPYPFPTTMPASSQHSTPQSNVDDDVSLSHGSFHLNMAPNTSNTEDDDEDYCKLIRHQTSIATTDLQYICRRIDHEPFDHSLTDFVLIIVVWSVPCLYHLATDATIKCQIVVVSSSPLMQQSNRRRIIVVFVTADATIKSYRCIVVSLSLLMQQSNRCRIVQICVGSIMLILNMEIRHTMAVNNKYIIINNIGHRRK